MPDSREALGRLVREVWTEWAGEQPDAKPSWLTGWDNLDPGQREVDMRIGETVAAMARATEREATLMPTLDGVYTRPTRYDVSVFPDEMLADRSSALDADTWSVAVEWRGMDTWAVCWMGRCLDKAGEWDYEPRPSSRDDEWLADHRFPLERALFLARKVASGVTVNGLTALDILERHRA